MLLLLELFAIEGNGTLCLHRETDVQGDVYGYVDGRTAWSPTPLRGHVSVTKRAAACSSLGPLTRSCHDITVERISLLGDLSLSLTCARVVRRGSCPSPGFLRAKSAAVERVGQRAQRLFPRVLNHRQLAAPHVFRAENGFE